MSLAIACVLGSRISPKSSTVHVCRTGGQEAVLFGGLETNFQGRKCFKHQWLGWVSRDRGLHAKQEMKQNGVDAAQFLILDGMGLYLVTASCRNLHN